MVKIVLGLSGGVDSAVSAKILQEKGFEVFGLFLDIGSNPTALEDAKKTAEFLNIPLRTADISRELEERVCRPFAEAYLRGETPNPCIMCNPAVKFKTLLEYADSIGAEYIATGHYAKAAEGGLYKGKPSNDQSYMLCRVTREQLARTIFPLGEFEKKQVRQLAREMGIPVAQKPDSMEICFIPDGDYGAYIEGRGDAPPEGNLVTTDGKILGTHRGIHRYTVGQRRGLGIAAGKRVFVSEIRTDTNEVVLSGGDLLYLREIEVSDINWLMEKSAAFEASVRIRHSKLETKAEILPENNGAKVLFKEPVRAPVRGQSAVFYDGERVIGGGYIC